MKINDQFKRAKEEKYGESTEVAKLLNSHMAKNSEWGAVLYLAQSQYGTKGEKIEQNTSNKYYTGGCYNKNDTVMIYTKNVKQSTTHNATGVYDMNGGAYERVAAYVNNNDAMLSTNGGTEKGDLYGMDTNERNTSTAYKTVYKQAINESQETNYEINKNMKGDALWETSNSGSNNTGSWYRDYALFPYKERPFLNRSKNYSESNTSYFSFNNEYGYNNTYYAFRLVLCP